VEGPLAVQGELWQGLLPGLLRDLYVGRRTGHLALSLGEERRTVRFRHGHILSADTNVREDRMGEVLVRHGLLSQADLKRATGFVLRDNKRLGVVLLELGLLDQAGLEDALALHVREVLSKIFSWSQGSYEFNEESENEAEPQDVTLRLSTGELILQAARSVQDPDLVRYNLGDMDRVLGLSSDPLLRFQKITLTPADGFVLSRIDGTLSAREVLELNPLPETETQRSLFGLLSTGVIEFLPLPPKLRAAPEPPRPRVAPPVSLGGDPVAEASSAAQAESQPAPAAVPAAPPVEATPEDPRRLEIIDAYEGIKKRTHFELLGIPRDATEAHVKEAYFRKAKRFHPDAHHDPALSDLRGKLEEVFIRLGEAYEVLRNPRIRASYERSLAPAAAASATPAAPAVNPGLEAEMAEKAIRKAERSVLQERYWEAIQLLEPAVSRAEGRFRQFGRVLLARAYAKNPNWVKQGEELLLTVIQEDPRNVAAYAVLGGIYRAGGLRNRAVTMLRKALELDPAYGEALENLAALEPDGPPPPEGGGLLKKLLRKR
jgi:tetratricopeptide (TPR) repeat protein